MLKTFINRPVLSTVISVIIVVLGIIGLVTLPVEQYPDIAPPTVQIEAFYSGANADVVMKSVVIPIEEQVNGVEGMTYMTSTASNNGQATIKVFFQNGINPDIAAVNVQNLVSKASSQLPSEVTSTGVTVSKQQTSTILFISVSSDNPQYDGQFIQNYLNINLIPEIKRVNGVGNASIYGAKDYSMRIWFNPERMASNNITPQEVVAALQDQNIEAAPGAIGENSDQTFQYTLKYTGRLKTEDEFRNIIVRSQNGQNMFLKEVADVELGSLNYSVNTQMNGNTGVMIGISQTSGSNAQEVIDNVKAVVDESAKLFPEGIKVTYMMDANQFLSASIEKVIRTLIEAFVLVFFVVFIFLQDFRSTLIPVIAVPVAIIGTFFLLQAFGFSINILTLFALVLAIGIVVDDAIVVVEAVHAQLDAGETDPRKATIIAMKEIAPAIVSITLVMSSVFIPVSFIGGTSGVFYKQFGLTLASAIVISAINALTLSPALCALFLKPHQEHGKKKSLLQRFYYSFNIAFNAGTQRYKSSLQFLGKKGHRWITVAIIVAFSGILFMLMKKIPTGFVPSEDSGTIMGMITLPPGSSLERTAVITDDVVKIARDVPHVSDVANITGISFLSGLGSSYSSIIIKMDNWSDRKITTTEVATLLAEKTKHIKDAKFLFFGTPTLQGFGLGAGISIELQDKLGGDIHDFYNVTSKFLSTMDSRKEVMLTLNTFDPNFPQRQIEANIPKIKEAGLTLSQVMTTLQAYIGSMYVSNFNVYGKQFRVMVQAAPEYRAQLDNLQGMYVKTASGEMAPITEFLTITDTTGPQALTRFNLYSSMSASIIPNYKDGYTDADVLKVIEEVSAQTLPNGYGYSFSGITREEANSGNETILIFGLCIIFVYLLLAALYESYILPLAVLFSLPIGLAGVFIFLFVPLMFGSGIINNIYVQISLIMLIGLLAKNAILIVEYAIQRRASGMSIVESAINGAVARLRPILMTSFAFIFGLFPLMLSTGANSVANRSIGLSAVGGMLIGTIIGILVIPSLYIIFQSIQEKVSKSGVINSENK